MTNLSIAVGIATLGRREQLTQTLEQLGRQKRAADRVLICPASMEDFDQESVDKLAFPVELVRGRRGSCAQRNDILDRCLDEDVLLFLDDDFYPAPDYLERLAAIMAAQPDVLIATGCVLADGAAGPGISHSHAISLLERAPSRSEPASCEETYGGYGCNFAVRLSVVREYALRFDENLPLYGWLEDIDFSRQIAAHGRIVRDLSLRGVHLGTKRGRTSGVRFGYSQLANPIYMLRKGTMSRAYALDHVFRNVAANLVRSLAPEPWVDRRGRLRGNMLAVRDLVRGRLHPRHVLEVE